MQLAQVIAAAAAVRLTVVSGTPQSAHAYVAPGARVYLTEFRQQLVVHVAGAVERIRFSCASPHCDFAPSEQPDTVHRVDENAYDVDVREGKASVTLTLSTPTLGTYLVTARPAAGHSSTRSVRFALTAR